MKILVAHNRYQGRGGEDVVFEAEVDLLRDAGHSVERLTVSNEAINSLEFVPVDVLLGIPILNIATKLDLVARRIDEREGMDATFSLEETLSWEPKASQRYADAEFEARKQRRGLWPVWLGER